MLKTIRNHAKKTQQEIRIIEGANHTRIWVGEKYTTLARHTEIPNNDAKSIYKQLGIN
ncbi:toxin HicA [Corynebacterium sp. sy017]|nr:toxin HicA [Corynebacterium sp. sy017]TSD92076.1 toxin HicA [Corynebacterium sp. SY003]